MRRRNPKYLDVQGNRYEVQGVRKDGRLILFKKDREADDLRVYGSSGGKVGRYVSTLYDPKIRRFINPGMSNSDENRAAEISEMWHGREPRELIEDTDEIVVPNVFAELGKLVEIEFENENGAFVLDGFGRRVSLAAGTSGSQLYIVGRVPIGEGDLIEFTSEYEAKKDKVHLGEATRIVYETDKHHLKDSNGEILEYEHEFGEDGGELPTLVYDKLNESLELVGGDYRIEDRGIVD